MANAANKAALQSEGGTDAYAPPVELVFIAEEDPTHPHHGEHAARVRLDDQDNIDLLESLRTFGWVQSQTISVYKDGKRFAVSNGRRRLTMLRIVNAERKAARPRLDPIRPLVVLDKNPLLTETVANAMQKGDSHMTLARRFVDLSATMPPARAAAALGLDLARANNLAAVLSTPSADLHAAVDSGAIPADIAAKAAKAGGEVVRKVIAKSRGEGGKIDGGKARDATRAAVPVRLKTRSPKTLISVASELEKIGFLDAAELIRWMQGGPPPVAYVKAIESAEDGRRKPAVRQGARMPKMSKGGKAGKS